MESRARLLVTGACGFIGRSIVEAADKWGYEAFGVGRCQHSNRVPGITYFDCDIRDELSMVDVFNAVKPQVVSHQAGTASVSHGRKNPNEAASVNVTGTSVVADLCRRHGARLALASTHSVYGNLDADRRPFKETDPVNPQSMYAASKRAAELVVCAAPLHYSVILRYGNVYGVGQRHGLFPAISKAELSGEPLRLLSPLDSTRDYIHIDDLVHKHFTVLCGPHFTPGTIFNVGSGISRTLGDVLDVASLFAKFTTVSGHGLIGDAVQYAALNVSKLSWGRVLKRPPANFVQSVKATLESLRPPLEFTATPVSKSDLRFTQFSSAELAVADS